MRVRFGVHCDTVVVGNVGSRARLSYTVMGDGVNVAARIEGLNKEFGTSICVSEDVYRPGVRPHQCSSSLTGPVKGRKTEIKVYELLGVVGSTDPKLVADRPVA